MTCSKRMEERIVHFAAGELAPVEVWLLRRHLRTCEACRDDWRRMEALRQQLRSRADCPTNPVLDARVFEALSTGRSAALPAPHVTAPRRALPGRASLAVGAAAVVAVGTFPFWGPLPGVAAGDVRTALARVETWHGRGWKTVEGQRVEWEVWGRRSPYLYWARTGSQVRIDNGRERLEFIVGTSGRHSGIVLRARSRLGLDDWTVHPDQLFTARTADLQPEKGGWRTTTFTTHLASEAPQEGSRVQFVVDRGARVPVRYLVRSDAGGEPTESLALEYGAELPPSVADPRWPEGYRVVDLLRKESGQSAPGTAAKAGGFSVHALPLAVDRTGNVLVRVRGWLDGMPLNAGAPFLLGVFDREESASAPVVTDDRGRKYRYVPLEWLRLMQHLRLNGDRLMIFAPAQPLAKSAPLPRRLTLNLNVAAVPSSQLHRAPGFDSVSVQESFQWNLTLPKRPAPLRPEQWLRPGWKAMVGSTGNRVESIESAVARLRATPMPKWE